MRSKTPPPNSPPPLIVRNASATPLPGVDSDNRPDPLNGLLAEGGNSFSQRLEGRRAKANIVGRRDGEVRALTDVIANYRKLASEPETAPAAACRQLLRRNLKR